MPNLVVTNFVPRKVDWVQMLRGIAALLVVFTHARYLLRGSVHEALAEALFLPGAIGVDLFFMISGFIMVLTTRTTDGSFREGFIFLIKRFSRIWPVYVVLSFIGLLGSFPFNYLLISGNFLNYAKSLAFLPVDPYVPLYFGIPYGPGWTLNFEMYFYLIFGFSLFTGRKRWITFFSWIIISLIVFPLLSTGIITLNVQHDYHFNIAYLNQIVSPMIWTFVVGVIVGLLYMSPLQLSNNIMTKCLMIGASTISIWWAYSGLSNFHGLSQWGGPLALAFAIVAVGSKTVDIPTPRVLVWLGEISFSLYLIHLMVQHLMSRLLESAGRADLIHTWSMIFITTVFSLILGALSHAILEKRLSEWVKFKLFSLFHLDVQKRIF